MSQGRDRKASSTPGTTTWLFAKMFAKWHYICEDDSEDMCLFIDLHDRYNYDVIYIYIYVYIIMCIWATD